MNQKRPKCGRIVLFEENLGNFGGIHTVTRALHSGFSSQNAPVEFASLEEPVGHFKNAFVINRGKSSTSLHRFASDYPGPLGIKYGLKRLHTPIWKLWRHVRIFAYLIRLGANGVIISTTPEIVKSLHFHLKALKHFQLSPIVLQQLHSSFDGITNHWDLAGPLKATLDVTDRLVLLSDSDSDAFSRMSIAKCTVIPNPCTIPIHYERSLKPKKTDKPHRMVFVGRLSGEKRVDLIISAFDAALAKRPDIRKSWVLEIYGAGVDAKYLTQVRDKSHYATNIRFMGRIDNIEQVFCGADLSVLASSFEGLPMTLIESIRCGTPPITTRCSGATRQITTRCGFLCDGDDIRTISTVMLEAMDEIIISPAKRLACFEVGHEFDLKPIMDSWWALIDSCRSERNRQRCTSAR